MAALLDRLAALRPLLVLVLAALMLLALLLVHLVALLIVVELKGLPRFAIAAIVLHALLLTLLTLRLILLVFLVAHGQGSFPSVPFRRIPHRGRPPVIMRRASWIPPRGCGAVSLKLLRSRAAATGPHQRPPGRIADDRVGVVRGGFERTHRFRIIACAEHERGVARQPDALGPRDRGSTEARAELLIRERHQRGRRRELTVGTKGRLCRRRGLPIPRTDLLADVAAEHPSCELAVQPGVEVAPVLDRQVRDTAARIENVRRDERLRRTGIEARAAGSTPVGHRCLGVEGGRRQDDADEEIRAQPLVEEIGVLPDPSQ